MNAAEKKQKEAQVRKPHSCRKSNTASYTFQGKDNESVTSIFEDSLYASRKSPM